MIQVNKVDNLVTVQIRTASYNFYNIKDKVKSLGFKWNPDLKAWVLPAAPGIVTKLERAFGDKVGYLLPEEEIEGGHIAPISFPPVSHAVVRRTKKLLSKYLKAEPFLYQWEGMALLLQHPKAILGDEMGLGKSFQLIAAIKGGFLLDYFRRVLLVCPSHLRYQWAAEFQKFTDIIPTVIDGNRKKRKKIYDALTDGVVIIGYELLRKKNRFDFDYLYKWPDCLVCDEIHHAKNRDTDTARTLRKIKTTYRWLASGTPYQKAVEDIYSIFEILDKNILGKWSDFQKYYLVYNFNGRYKELVGYRHLSELAAKIRPYIIRRLKTDVVLQLPQKQQQTILVAMTESQKQIAANLRAMMQETLEQLQVTKNPKTRQQLDNRYLSLFTFSLMNTDSPELLKISNSKMAQQLVKGKSIASPKLDMLEDIVQEKLAGGEKVVIFTQFKEFLKLISKRLAKNKIGVVEVSGDVPMACSTKRSKCSDCPQLSRCVSRKKAQYLFNNDPKIGVLVATDAGQEGLNLQAGSTLIHADLLWNPAGMDQRSDRIHRADSKHEKVHIISLIAAGSIEERILAALEERRELGRNLIDIKKVV
ncbi:RNA polymerase-associated protein RapA [Moorella thermoacetica]|uniref:RNA polymerase-associated protein RapA n=1 Tax=Neomoorella thermoacetica TaxID=1525 RepID=A0AAC9HIP0_NEOTH|nr:DEAD/DEAH box helicase [Moorella thermoacetica]AOQ24634.1 RNA polymerase-associated protein RapA [Moorella thermoacetica]TYL12737.1 RNA polymerase-associated protein RapA [Moorella thermoacetica]